MSSTENADFLLKKAMEAGITDRRELAIFMGQMQVESGDFRSMHESLNYRPERLLEVFGPYTDKRGNWHDGRNGLTNLEEARTITAGGQEAIANAVYGGRWGATNLGNTESGDGWKFHGRGYVQLTGRENYERAGRELGIDLVNNPDLAADRDVAAKIAVHYWDSRVRSEGHQLNVREATQDINGGYKGLKERGDAADAWMTKFQQGYLEKPGLGEALPNSPAATRIQADPLADGRLQPGERGERVRHLQQQLVTLGTEFKDSQGRALAPTGFYAQQTEAAVRNFQGSHNLPQTGIADEATRTAIDAAVVQRRSSPDPVLAQPARTGPQSFDDIMRVMLPPQAGTNPHITSDYGPRTLNGKPDHHGGVDFNYVGGQNGINLQHPTVRSPVSGVVVYGAGQGTYGTVKIRDDQGNMHEILHLDSRLVRLTDPPTRIEAGDPIGTMGGRGPKSAGEYLQHVHYQMRGPNNNLIDPEAYWNNPQRMQGREEPAAQPRQNRMETPIAEGRTANAAPSAPPRSEAMADGVLRRGETAPEVGQYQRILADLGYRGADGKPLEVDNKFGQNTEFATRQFQRDHDIEQLGVIGPKTRAAAEEAGRGLVTHPDNPNNGLYKQSLEHVHQAEDARRVPHGEHSRNLAAALTVEAVRERVVQIDRVEFSPDGSMARAVQFSQMGDRPEINRNTDGIATLQAAQQPIRESSQQTEQVASNVQIQQTQERQQSAVVSQGTR